MKTRRPHARRGRRPDLDAQLEAVSVLEVQNAQLRHGDFFLCASERQRDFWLGALHTAGRVNAPTYAPTPRCAGSSTSSRSACRRGFRAGRATGARPGGRRRPQRRAPRDRRRRQGPLLGRLAARLAGSADADPRRGPTREHRRATSGSSSPARDTRIRRWRRCASSRPASISRASSACSTRHVFFNDWIPYEQRAAYLHEADLGVSTHRLHLETHLSFRTRMLDYSGGRAADRVHRGRLLRGARARPAASGSTVPPGSAEALAAAIARLLDDRASAGVAAAHAAAEHPGRAPLGTRRGTAATLLRGAPLRRRPRTRDAGDQGQAERELPGLEVGQAHALHIGISEADLRAVQAAWRSPGGDAAAQPAGAGARPAAACSGRHRAHLGRVPAPALLGAVAARHRSGRLGSRRTGRVYSQADILLDELPVGRTPAAGLLPAAEHAARRRADDLLPVPRARCAKRRATRRLPTWNPHIFGGQPFIGASQSAVFSPFTAIAFCRPAARRADLDLPGAAARRRPRHVRAARRRRPAPAGRLVRAVWRGCSTPSRSSGSPTRSRKSRPGCRGWCGPRGARAGAVARDMRLLALVTAAALFAGHPETTFKALLLCGVLALAFATDARPCARARRDRRRATDDRPVSRAAAPGASAPPRARRGVGCSACRVQVLPTLEYLRRAGSWRRAESATGEHLRRAAGDARHRRRPQLPRPPGDAHVPADGRTGTAWPSNYAEQQAYAGDRRLAAGGHRGVVDGATAVARALAVRDCWPRC